jgi:hypothetical protein
MFIAIFIVNESFVAVMLNYLGIGTTRGTNFRCRCIAFEVLTAAVTKNSSSGTSHIRNLREASGKLCVTCRALT